MTGIVAWAETVKAAWPPRWFARPPDLNAQADAARDARNWPAAAALYWQVAERASEPFGLWVQCGNCAKESGDLDLAEKAYTAARALQPDDADLHLQFGHLRKRQGRAREALAHYRTSMQLDGNVFATEELRALAADLDERATTRVLFWGDGAAPFDIAYMATAGADCAGTDSAGTDLAGTDLAGRDLAGAPKGAARSSPLLGASSSGSRCSAGTLRADAILADLWRAARPHGTLAELQIHISLSA